MSDVAKPMALFTEQTFTLSVIASAICLLLCAIFITAGLSKLKKDNRRYYKGVIDNYGLNLDRLTEPLVVVIGMFEVIIALSLLIPASQGLGLMLAIVMLFVYLLAFAKQLIAGKRDMNCGCAGPASSIKISPLLLLRNAVLISLCLFALTSPLTTLVPALASTELSNLFAFISLSLLLGSIVGLSYLSAEQLIVNRQKVLALRQANH